MKAAMKSNFVFLTRALVWGAAVSVLVACPVVPPEDLTLIHGGDNDNPSHGDSAGGADEAPQRYVTSVLIDGKGPLTVGGTLQMTVLLTYDDASTSTDATAVYWYSGNGAILTVVNGLVTAVGAGTTTIYAVGQGGVTSNTVELSANPAGIELDCGAVLFASQGVTCNLWALDSESARSQVIGSELWTLSSSSGLVTVTDKYVAAHAGADGSVDLTATYNAVSPALTDGTSIDVVYITAVTVAGDASVLVSGTNRTFTATPVRESAGPVPASVLSQVVWTPSNGVITVLGTSSGTTGNIQGNMIGSGTLIASVGTAASTPVELTVKPSTVVLSSDTLDVQEGDKAGLGFQAKNSANANVETDPSTATIVWSKDGTGFTVDAASGSIAGQTAGGDPGHVWVTVNTVASNHAAVTVVSVRQAPYFGGLVSAALAGDNTSVTLAWAVASDTQTPSAITYEIYYGVGGVDFAGAPATTVANAVATGTTLSGLTRGSTYTFGVCATDRDTPTPHRYCGSGTPADVPLTGPSTTLFIPNANPANKDDMVLYLNGTDHHIYAFNRTTPATRVDLGSVLFGTGGTVDVTAPAFMPDGRIVGIGQSSGNQQTVYLRQANGSFAQVGTPFTVNTNGRGVSAPGSARAFGLSDGRIGFTKGGTTTDTVNLYVMNADGTSERQAPLFDVERVAPTTTGQIAAIWYGNLYLITPPATLSNMTQSFSVRPATTDSLQGGKLLFGRKSGAVDTLVTLDQGGATIAAVEYDITSGHALTASPHTVAVTPETTGFAGGFVQSTGGILWNGALVVHHVAAADAYQLFEINLATDTASAFAGSFGRANVDTAR